MTLSVSSPTHVANREGVRQHFFFLLGRTNSWGKFLLDNGFEAQWLMIITKRHLSGAFW